MSGTRYSDGFWARRASRRRVMRTGVVGGAGLATAALVGCGDDDDGAAQPQTGGQAAAGTKKRGGTLAFSLAAEPPHLDVHQTSANLLGAFGPAIAYSRLLKWDLGPQGMPRGNQTPQGDLVEKWEQPDTKTFIFTLRKGVKFHNKAPVNGRELVAEDVVFSLDRQQKIGVNGDLLVGVKKISATDKYTVRIDYDRAAVDDLLNYGDSRGKIVAREVVSAFGDLKTAPVIGTNAWIFSERDSTHSQVQKYVRNPDHFNKDEPYADAMDFLSVADRATLLSAFRAQRIHSVGTLVPEEQQILRGLGTFIDRQSGRGPYLLAHTKNAPTSDIRVRQALSKAIDRQVILDTAYNGKGRISTGLKLETEEPLLPEAEFRQLLARDVAGARRLLQEAGVSNWSPKMLFNPAEQVIAELAQRQLREVGINTTLESADIVRQTDQILKGNFEHLYLGLAGTGTTTTVDLRARWGTGGTLNGPTLSDPTLDRLIDQQAYELDKAKRVEVLKQIQRRIIEVASEIPLAVPMVTGINQPFLKDFLPTVADFFEPNIYQVAWLDK